MHYQQWWRSQPKNREKPNQYEKQYYWQDSENKRKRSRKWHKEHPQKCHKWRKNNPEKRNRQRKANYDKGAIFDTRSGTSYEDVEIQMILDKILIGENGRIIKRNITDREIAKHIGRTVGAIQVQRTRSKKKSTARPEINS